MALDRCKEMYETPTVRAYNGIANMLEKLAFYMETQTITDGRDGNITAIVSAAKNFDAIRKSFKGVAKDLEEEQSSRARGGQKLSYDD
jgi:virulence-associated protein VapD